MTTRWPTPGPHSARWTNESARHAYAGSVTGRLVGHGRRPILLIRLVP